MNERIDDTVSSVPGFLAGGGATTRDILATDWSATLGDPSSWPEGLRTTLATMLTSPQPMFLAWGPDLLSFFNDAYRPMLGARLDGAIGMPFPHVWSDIWTEIEPIVDKALAGEGSRFEDMPLVMTRNGYPEDTWWTFTYMPLRDADGSVRGMFCVTTEVTYSVVAQRHAVQERQRLTNLLEQSPGFMAFLEGPDHRIVLANPAYLKLVGHREVLGRTVSDALPDAVAQGYLDLLDNVRSSGEAYVSTGAKFAVQASEDGPVNERYLDFVYQPIIGPDSQVTGIFVEGSDVTERNRAEDHLHLMVNELNHRVKNSLATVIAIAAQTFRDPDTFERSKADFTGRIITLAAAHDLLTESNWSGATMRQVIDRTVGPHGDGSGPRFDLDGPHVRLDPKMALSLSMAIHELCTNAVKYGALSIDPGHVDIVWRVEGMPEGRRLLLTWIERDGPTVEPPTRKGFGSRLIERSLAAELDGEVEIRYEPTGVVCTIDAPLPSMT